MQVDAQKKRFLFMYYGRKFDVKFFQGKFELATIEGTVDDRGCHYVFVKTESQIRTSQLHAAINEYNLCVPGNMVMRLQEEIYQPVIVTMSSKRMEGSIYSKIIQDKQKKCNGERSNFWSWDPELLLGEEEQQLVGVPSSYSDDCGAIRKDKALLSGMSSSVESVVVVAANETVTRLSAENVRLSSELMAANEAVTALSVENVRLSSELVAANGVVASLACEIIGLKSEADANAEELNSKMVSLNGMKTTINTLNDSFKEADQKYTQALEDARETRKYCEGLREKLDKEMTNPSAPSGTFGCLVSALQFAETACVDKQDGTDWDPSELKYRVVNLVRNMMMPTMRIFEFDQKVHEVVVVHQQCLCGCCLCVCFFLPFLCGIIIIIIILLPDQSSSV